MDQVNYRLPKRKDGQKTFDHILETAKKLFSKNGYQATSINEIINKAGIATGTFYLYFDDKFALYSYLLAKYRKSIRKAISEGIHDAHTRYEKERLGLRSFLKFAWQDPLAYRIIWESMFADKELFKEYYQTFSHDYVRQLNLAVGHGEVRDDVDLETLSYMLMGISNFVGLQVLFRDTLTDLDLDRITDNVMKVLKTGMFNEK
ncbi:MAG: TetR/AcrR family transcriptional regulator [Acholeplasmataceae bacterium]|nr:TetR/AcrR family transcriptional regulator [Acholeplasmataceae bacterium]